MFNSHKQLKQILVAIRNVRSRRPWKQHRAAVMRRLQIVISDTSLKTTFTFNGLIFRDDYHNKLNHCPRQQYRAPGSKPCMGYLSLADEFQAFWYEKACQVKTGQNIYIELCTLHGNHNSYAETWSINACFPQLLLCVGSPLLSPNTLTEVLYYWMDSKQAWQEYQMHNERILDCL